jgi:hypothetical protein
LPELKVLKDQLVLQVLLEVPEHPVELARLETLVQLDRREQLARQAAWVHQVLLVQREVRELLVQPDRLEPQVLWEHQDRVDLLDFLEQWA